MAAGGVLYKVSNLGKRATASQALSLAASATCRLLTPPTRSDQLQALGKLIRQMV
jgi:hypothetical protein